MRLLLTWNGQAVVAASVAAARPLAARILVGQAADQVVALVPRLFSLCGQAQGVAARLALHAARGETVGAEELDSALRSVALEAIGEHLWRLLLDWPPLLGQTPRKEAFLAWRKRLTMVIDAAAAARLGAELTAWLQQEAPPGIALPPALARGSLLTWLSAPEWARQSIDDAFAARPTASGQPAETGALARQCADRKVSELRNAGYGVAARLAARYLDLRALANGLIDPALLDGWVDVAPAGENCGLARIETARGVLLHRIQVRDGTVERYVIVAPTEWNFHPDGAFVREIVGSPAPTRAQVEATARCLALALDPCVAYEVEVREA